MSRKQVKDVELRKDSLSLGESVIMGIAGTAPAYSIAATMAALIASVGTLSTASLLYCGLIMFGITLAYLHLNKTHAHAGAAYKWVGDVFHPFLGFLAGWALLVSTTIFMVSGTIPAATATLALLSPTHANNPVSVTIVAALWLIAVGCILFKGIKVSSIFQVFLTVVEVAILVIVLAGVYVQFAAHPVQEFQLQQLSLTSFTPMTFATGALTALFFFWGWDVTLNLSEETKEASRNPGRGGVIAMIIVLLLFMGFALATQFTLTDKEVEQANTNVVLAIADKVFPQPWGYMAIIAVMLSTVGTLETSILQFSRTMFAKGRDGVLHSRYAILHKSWKTPWISIAMIVFAGLVLLFLSSFYSTVNDIIKDSVNAIAFQVAFYYSLTGFACAWKFRKLATQAWNHFLTLLVWPILSSCFLVFIGIYSLFTFDATALTVAIGGLALGIVPYTLNVLVKHKK